MKKLLTWGAVGQLTSALLDPLIYSMLDLQFPSSATCSCWRAAWAVSTC